MATSGHGLLFEGAPHAQDHSGRVVRTNTWGVGGWGRGVCRCGAMSDMLDSANKRKAWHRAHKAGLTADTDHSPTDCWCRNHE